MGGSVSNGRKENQKQYEQVIQQKALVKTLVQEQDFHKYNNIFQDINDIFVNLTLQILHIVHDKEGMIIFWVTNIANQKQYYLKKIKVDSPQEIQSVLAEIQLSNSIRKGFMLNYFSSFASEYGNFIYIIYEYIEIITLEDFFNNFDKNSQNNQQGLSKLEIIRQIYEQILSIYFLLGEYHLTISNLNIQNIHIFKEQQKPIVKLLNIKLQNMENHQFKINEYWTLDDYLFKQLIKVFDFLLEQDIDKTQQIIGVIADLQNNKLKLGDIKSCYIKYKEEQIQQIKTNYLFLEQPSKENLNKYLFKYNESIGKQLQYRHQQQKCYEISFSFGKD